MTVHNQVICEKRSYRREFTSHQHEFGQFLFPLVGSLDIHTKNQDLVLKPDSCFYLPPDLNHLYRSKERNEFLILDIPKNFIPHQTDRMLVHIDEQWSAIRSLLVEESRRRDSNALNDLTRYITSKLEISLPTSIIYLHENFKKPIRLEKLAEIEHYHPTYYSTWFKQKTGKSPKQYLSDLRMNEAKTLLLQTDWTMTRISEEIGFDNSSSFTRWFVKQEGVSPNRYRYLKNR
ncbi:helix-turn-helix transcriptional regulator [Bacillus weihaiensis]|uniref:helix-turn-helix transcriptional regulator n=1 Tax=Bacillus weihaiensis TaxID=1547283 RepID=UPI002353E6E8|nr:AraC family transcriptional regulator [Bacillus weihaiensis]